MISRTVIWFIVSVPVLSELIAEVEPSVSTAGSVFMMAFFLAMATEPIDEDEGDDGGQGVRDRADRQGDADGEQLREGSSPWARPITTMATKREQRP